MFPFITGCRDVTDRLCKRAEGGSDPQALCTHAKPAGSVVRCSNVPRNPLLSDLYTPCHNLQSAGRVVVRHKLELVETHHDHRLPLTATNTHRFKPVYAESGPLNRAELHITPAGYGRYSRMVSGSLLIPFTARNCSGQATMTVGEQTDPTTVGQVSDAAGFPVCRASVDISLDGYDGFVGWVQTKWDQDRRP